MKKCACGCGAGVSDSCRFIRGHNTRGQNPAKGKLNNLSTSHIRGPINRKRPRRVKLDPWLVEIGLTMEQLDEFRAEQKRSALAAIASHA